MNLNKIREEIDDIDTEIMDLLNKRLNLSLKVKTFKEFHDLPIVDKKREKQIISKIKDYDMDEEIALAIRDIYREIFKQSRKMQI